MKTKTLVLIAVMIAFGLTTVFGQGMQMHTKSTGHQMDKMKSHDAPDSFKKQLASVLDNYLLLKDALVASDEMLAQTAAQKTLDALMAVDMTLLQGDAHMKWMEYQKPIESNLRGIVQMKGIDMKRSHFGNVSEDLSEALKVFGVDNNETIYIDYCPMANNKRGGYWLSTEEDINNPYFGGKMLKCGSVKGTI